MEFKIEEKYRKSFLQLSVGKKNILAEISNLLVRNQSVKLDQSLLKETSLQIDKKLDKFLKIETDTICFKHKEYFILAYVFYICQTKILNKSSESENLIQFINEASWNLSQVIDEHVLFEEVFMYLSMNHEYNIAKFVNGLVKTHEDFWDVYSPFCKVLKVLEFEIEDLISFLNKTLEYRKGDYMGGQISNTFAFLAIHKPFVAMEIKSKLLASKSEDLIYLLPNLYVELSKNNFEKIYNELYGYTKSEEFFKINLGITTLGRLEYNSREDYFGKTQNRLRKLIKSGDAKIKAACCKSINFLLNSGNIQSGELLLNLDFDIPEIQAEIAGLLVSNKNNINETEWSEKLLYGICTTDAKYTRITSNIDQYLSFLFNQNKKIVEKFLDKWVDCHEKNALDIPKVFTSLMIKLKNEFNFLQSLVSKWLNENDSKFHFAVSNITSYFFQSEEKEQLAYLELDEKVVKSFDFRDAKYVVFKILGYVVNSHQKSSLVFSLLKNNTVIEIDDLVVNSFVEVILYDYPVRKDFLERKRLNGNKREQDTAESILNEFKKYEDALDSLETLKELNPSRNKIKSEQMIERERIKKIQEGAKESSLLLNFVKNVSIKYGKGWTYYQEGKIMPPTYMQSISTTFHIPRTEFINPVNAKFQSIHWRMISREDVL